MLGTTNLYNDMILSTLSINSHDFAFGFPKGLVPIKIVFLTCKPVILLLISQCGTTLNNPRTHERVCFVCSEKGSPCFFSGFVKSRNQTLKIMDRIIMSKISPHSIKVDDNLLLRFDFSLGLEKSALWAAWLLVS